MKKPKHLRFQQPMNHRQTTFTEKLNRALSGLQESTGLSMYLERLRPQFAIAAQRVLDDWVQDDDGFDDVFGGGGVCDAISEALVGVVMERIPDAEAAEYGHDGDDHAAAVIHNGVEAYLLDIPPYVYESGGGMSWRKKEGVIIDPGDIEIIQLNIADVLG